LRKKTETIWSPEEICANSNPLIVGIDPGITTGIAILNLDGEIVLTESRRNFSRAGIVKFVSNFGKPIIIATDMNPAPTTVEKLATAFPARLFYPESTLKRKDKAKLVKELEVKPNRHEKDALAAAIYAYKRISPIINKVKQKMKSCEKEKLCEEIVSRILRIQDISTVIKRKKKI
jgi:hypothetical protein